MSARKSACCAGVLPSTLPSPVLALLRPVRSLSKVDLPAPFGPTSADTLPSGTLILQFFNAQNEPYFLPSCFVCIAILVIGYPPILNYFFLCSATRTNASTDSSSSPALRALATHMLSSWLNAS